MGEETRRLVDCGEGESRWARMFLTWKKKKNVYIHTYIRICIVDFSLRVKKSLKDTDPNDVSVSEKFPAPYFQAASTGASMLCLY